MNIWDTIIIVIVAIVYITGDIWLDYEDFKDD